MSNILIIGATSAIARSCARQWINPGNKLFLVARHQDKLQQTLDDLKVSYDVEVGSFVMDAEDHARYPEMLEAALAALGSIDIVLLAHGVLPDAEACAKSLPETLKMFNCNATATIALLAFFANHFAEKEAGTIAVISSVAGDRGRASNYLYGSSKAAVSTFAEGLAARFVKQPNIHVLTIKPGFVQSPMTAHLPTPGLLSASADEVASDIVKAVKKGRSVLYTPFYWRWIMAIIKHLPRAIFYRLKI